MRRLVQILVLLFVVALLSAPQQARAEGFVTPWAGVIFGNKPADGRGTFGISAGAMGAGVFGGEVDFGYSPSFFGTKSVFGSNSVMSLMGNVILGIPFGGTTGGGLRPYATAGLGLIRTEIDGPADNDGISTNDVGFNAGAGVMGYFNDRVGLRGDLRYFRNLQDDGARNDFDLDLGGFDYWRLSIGVVIR